MSKVRSGTLTSQSAAELRRYAQGHQGRDEDGGELHVDESLVAKKEFEETSLEREVYREIESVF